MIDAGEWLIAKAGFLCDLWGPPKSWAEGRKKKKAHRRRSEEIFLGIIISMCTGGIRRESLHFRGLLLKALSPNLSIDDRRQGYQLHFCKRVQVQSTLDFVTFHLGNILHCGYFLAARRTLSGSLLGTFDLANFSPETNDLTGPTAVATCYVQGTQIMLLASFIQAYYYPLTLERRSFRPD